MAITQLDPKAALVVIDLQKGLVAMAPDRTSGVVANTSRLAEAFRRRGLPVVLVNVTAVAPGRTDATRPDFSQVPAGFTELIPELKVQPSDILISKQSFGALVSTGLHQQLQQLGVTQIVLTGVSTSVGVESTARSAYDLGYNVAFASDAMTDRSLEAHETSLKGIFPRIGQLETTENLLKLLAA